MGMTVLAIGLGAAAGAVLRWLLGVWLNAWWPTVPPGTLAANVIGGYLIGLAVVYFTQQVHLAPEWRLFVMTGFLGGLTTFSTFSVEVMRLLMDGRVAWAGAAMALHVGGALLATWAGMLSASRWLKA
jgi:fluoride exporter